LEGTLRRKDRRVESGVACFWKESTESKAMHSKSLIDIFLALVKPSDAVPMMGCMQGPSLTLIESLKKKELHIMQKDNLLCYLLLYLLLSFTWGYFSSAESRSQCARPVGKK